MIDFEPPKCVAIIKDIMKYNNPDLDKDAAFAIIKLCPFFSEEDMKDHIGESLQYKTCELIWWGEYKDFLYLLKFATDENKLLKSIISKTKSAVYEVPLTPPEAELSYRIKANTF